MIGLFFVVFLVLAIFFELKSEEKKWKKIYAKLAHAFRNIMFVFFMLGCAFVVVVGTNSEIDSKIAIYEEENAIIEESIKIAIKSYIDCESDVNTKLNVQDIVNIMFVFNEIEVEIPLQKQVEVYVSNTERLKNLKKEKDEQSKIKWLLYFGK